MVGLRLPQEFTNRVDQWARQNRVTRSEAIRRLVEIALAGTSPKQRSRTARSKARELANAQLEALLDPTVPTEERQRRKRRLIKGPQEFREVWERARSK
jgi:metal-responsive CopG/Arc/MetJ family transcriptional regulator